jgi:hypothetical protein
MTDDTGKIIGDAFNDVSLDKGLCAWVDLLGTTERGFPKRTIEQLGLSPSLDRRRPRGLMVYADNSFA